jgi:hypothetical protein
MRRGGVGISGPRRLVEIYHLSPNFNINECTPYLTLTFDTSFHEYGFRTVETGDVIRHGPFSNKRPRSDDPPGPPTKSGFSLYHGLRNPSPPLNHADRGASWGLFLLSKNLILFKKVGPGWARAYQKNKCLSSETSKYPENCFTVGSHDVFN